MDRLLKDPRAWGLMMAAMLTIMSNATITPSLPGLEARFADDPRAATLTRLLITAPSLLVGSLTDRLGRRKPLLVGMVIYTVAGTAGLYLDSIEAILVSRLVLGLGVASIMTSQAALVGDYFEGPARGRLMGYQIAATNLGGLVFVSVAGVLAAQDARLPFAIYGLAGLLLPILSAILPEPARAADGRPVSGPHLTGAEPGWQGVVAVMAGAAMLTFVIFYAIPTQLPYQLNAMGLTDPTSAGAAMGAMMLAAAIASIVSGLVRPRLGRIGTPVTGYLLLATGFAGLTAFAAGRDDLDRADRRRAGLLHADLHHHGAERDARAASRADLGADDGGDFSGSVPVASGISAAGRPSGLFGHVSRGRDRLCRAGGAADHHVAATGRRCGPAGAGELTAEGQGNEG